MLIKIPEILNKAFFDHSATFLASAQVEFREKGGSTIFDPP